MTGWAQLHGHPIGILANAQGVLFSEEAQKATQFVQLANQTDTPLLFLHNTTGYMVGKEYEQGGIIKHGAMMINAISNSTVPHLSVIMGASYGAGNYGMNGRAYDPRFLFTWPSAKSAVMGPAQLAGVLSIVARAAAEAQGHGRTTRRPTPACKEFIEASVEEQTPALLPLRDGLRRRRHRPARDPHRARHLPVRDRQQGRTAAPTASASSGCDAGPMIIQRLLVANRGEIASRVFRDLPQARHRDRGGALRRRRGAAVRARGRRRGAAARQHARRDLPARRPDHRGRPQGRGRRDPPRLRLPVRERRLRPQRHRRRARPGSARTRVPSTRWARRSRPSG